MTVSFQNYGYSAPNYATQQSTTQKYSAQNIQQPQTTTFESTQIKTKKKTNKGAIIGGLTATAVLAATAFAASKGKKITGQENVIKNIKAGFNEIKDDVIKFAKSKFKNVAQNADEVGEAVQGAIKPNNVEKGLSVITQPQTKNITQTINEVVEEAVENVKPESKEIKGILETYIDEAGKKISITNDGFKIIEDLKGFKINNVERGIDKYYSYQSKSEKAQEILRNTYAKAKEILSGLQTSITNYINK